MYKRFDKGEIVPYEIIDRYKWNYEKVKFGVEVELRDNVLYPVYPLKKGESLIEALGSFGTIKCKLCGIPYNDIMIEKNIFNISLIDTKIYHDYNIERKKFYEQYI